ITRLNRSRIRYTPGLCGTSCTFFCKSGFCFPDAAMRLQIYARKVQLETRRCLAAQSQNDTVADVATTLWAVFCGVNSSAGAGHRPVATTFVTSNYRKAPAELSAGALNFNGKRFSFTALSLWWWSFPCV